MAEYPFDVGDDLFPGELVGPYENLSFIDPFGPAKYAKLPHQEAPSVPSTLQYRMIYGPQGHIQRSDSLWQIQSAVVIVDTFDLTERQFIRHSFLLRDVELEIEPDRFSLAALSRSAERAFTHSGDCIETGAMVQLQPDRTETSEEFGGEIAASVVEGIVSGAVEGLISRLLAE